MSLVCLVTHLYLVLQFPVYGIFGIWIFGSSLLVQLFMMSYRLKIQILNGNIKMRRKQKSEKEFDTLHACVWNENLITAHRHNSIMKAYL